MPRHEYQMRDKISHHICSCNFPELPTLTIQAKAWDAKLLLKLFFGTRKVTFWWNNNSFLRATHIVIKTLTP